MGTKFAVTILTTVVISLTCTDPTKAEQQPSIQKRASPDLWSGPETEFFQSDLHGRHAGKFNFNVKRDTYRIVTMPDNNAAKDISMSSSTGTHLKSEQLRGQAGDRDEEGIGKRIPM